MRRSMLFMPGNNPGMLLNAGIHGADGIIFDLEDAVAPQDKDAARILVRYALESINYPCQMFVRVNDVTSEYWEKDIREIVCPQLAGLVIPKAQKKEDIQRMDALVTEMEKERGVPAGQILFMLLVETSLGVENAFELAVSSPRVESLALGAVDLAIDLHSMITPEGGVPMLYPRSRLLGAARAAGICIYDTSFTNVDDLDALRKDCIRAKELGYDGRPIIFPAHVPIVNEIFSPTQEEIDYSYEVIEILDKAAQEKKFAARLHGKMVDAANYKRAKMVVEMVESWKGGK